MTDRDRYKRHFREAMNTEAKVDTVRFEAGPSADRFTMEFAAGGKHIDPYWNVASYPPCDETDLTDWTVEASGDAFVLVESDAESPEEALQELEMLAEDVAGEDPDVTYKKVFQTMKSPKVYLKAFAMRAKQVVNGVSGR